MRHDRRQRKIRTGLYVVEECVHKLGICAYGRLLGICIIVLLCCDGMCVVTSAHKACI